MRSFFEVITVCAKKMDADAVQECGFCKASVSVFCSGCGEAYCQACSERWHSRAGKRDHSVQQLKSATAEAESIPELIDDAANEDNPIWCPTYYHFVLVMCREKTMVDWDSGSVFSLASLHGWQLLFLMVETVMIDIADRKWQKPVLSVVTPLV